MHKVSWVMGKFQLNIQFYRYTLILLDNGTLVAFGRNNRNELGSTLNGRVEATPTPISYFLDKKVQFVCAGYEYSLVLSQNGVVHSFGSNIQGQLGQSHQNPYGLPAPIISITNIVKLSAGFAHAFATDGTLWAWGGNTHGQLGLTHFISQFSPQKHSYFHAKADCPNCWRLPRHTSVGQRRNSLFFWQ
jgi:alpha-tubulin suppressor-like RCC1 family protein